MLAVILWILKIIGVLLLVILGLVLTLVLAVLLVPIRYQAEGSWYGELKASASVSWLLHIISLRAVYGERWEVALRIFGFRIGAERKPGRKKKKSRRKTPRQESRAEETEERHACAQETDKRHACAQEMPKTGTDRGTEDGGASETVQPSGQEIKPPQNDAESKESDDRREKGQEDDARKKKRRKERFAIGRFCDKLKEMIRRIRHMAKAVWQKLAAVRRLAGKGRESLHTIRQRAAELGERKERLIAFFKDEENQKTLKLLKRQIFALLKHVLPRRLKGKLRFGFDDPYTTGQVLMYLAPFYGLYAKRLELIPVFEEPVLDGELYLKGRIRIGTVLLLAARMMLNRNFRRLLKKWREG